MLCVLALGTVLAFLQIERGTGDRTMVLVFTLFDLLLVSALATALLSMTRRWRVAVVTGVAIVLGVYFASWLKMQYTAMAAQASDLVMLYSAWDLVKPFAWRAIAVLAVFTGAFAILVRVEKPLYRDGRTRSELAS